MSRAYPSTRRRRGQNLLPTAPSNGACGLDAPGDRQREGEREDEPFPGGALERLAAEVSEHRGVRRPRHGGEGVVPRKPRPGEVRHAGGEGDRGATTRDEPSDDD